MLRNSWLGVVLVCWSALSFAQTYPSQALKLTVPWPPGGGVDTTARMIAQPLATALGQAVVIENKPGAGGNIGTEQFARAKPDGYSILMGSLSPNAVNIHMYKKLGFDPVADFLPVIYVSAVPNILVVPTNSPVKNVAELIALAKANPGKLNYGSAGVGSSQHLAGIVFIQSTGVEVVHVPYKGTAPAEADLMAGHVSFMLDTTACLALIAGGKLRALAVASKERNPALPDTPTFDELGIPGVHVSSWYGVMVPAGTPKPIIDRLNTELNKILKSPELKKRMADFGAEIGGGTPEAFGAYIASETVRYEKIVRLSGAKVD